MNFNFTGSTGKRNINLGNRTLTGKNKVLFLKSAILDREKRETLRLQQDSANIIQSACKRYLELKKWRYQLSRDWDGKSIIHFKYFFPYVITQESYEVSIALLMRLSDVFDSLDNNEYNILLNTLMFATINIVEQYDPKCLELINSMLHIIEKICEKIDVVPSKHTLQFTKPLIRLYDEGYEGVLYYIYKFVTILSVQDLLSFAIKHSKLFEISIADEWISEYLKFSDTLFEKLMNLPDMFLCLPEDKKLILLSRISMLIYKFPQFHSPNKTYFTIIYMLLNSFTCNIYVAEKNDPMPSNNSPVYYKDSELIMSLETFNLIKLLYKDDHFLFLYRQQPDIHFLINYISSLINFTRILISDETNLLELELVLNWIIKDKTTQLIETCLFNISTFKDVIHLKSISNSDLEQLMHIESNMKWWNSMSIFQEFLLNILSFTADEDFFASIVITKEQFTYFATFLKLIVSEVLIKYRDIRKKTIDNSINSKRNSFPTYFKRMLTLIHAIYLKDVKLHIFADGFWILNNFELDTKGVIKAIPLLDKLHENELLDDDKESSNYDFLLNPKLTVLANKNISKRTLDSLYLLTYAPYMILFEKRAEIFHGFIEHDKKANPTNSWFPTKSEGTVSRDNILLDSFEEFGSLTGQEFKKPFSVSFVNQFGETEVGIDGGGITKELLTCLISSAFVPSEENRRLNNWLQFFKTGENYKLYFNPEFYFKLQYERLNPGKKIPYACTNDEYLRICNFLGKIVGKCLYDNVLLDISFIPFFLKTSTTMGGLMFKNLIGDRIDFVAHTCSFDELKYLDETLYQSLNYLLRVNSTSKFEEMALDFVVEEDVYDIHGKKHQITLPLLPYKSDGKAVPVTLQNKMQFIRMVTTFRLSKQTDLMMRSFVEGLFQVIDPHWLLLFDPNEMQTLISGEDDIDLEDLKKNVVLGGGYTTSSKTIVDLFEILKEFNHKERGKFVKFVTSSSKQPLLGFKELNPKFGIFNAGSEHRLPTASTCINLLKLPNYKDKKILKEKLLYSINSKAGFDLS